MKMKNIKLSLVAVLVCLSLALSAVSVWAGGVSGTVKETMVSGGYSYMLIDTGEGEIWAAVPRMEVKAGDQVELKPGMVMTDFTSKTMGRIFPEIVFSAGAVGAQAPVAKDSGADSVEEKPLSLTVEPGEIVKPEVTDAYTVEELILQSEELAGKKIVVRGKAVKVSRGIMGMNWVHLQDGSGQRVQETNDIVVTTSWPVKEGQVVTMGAVVAVNRDFGSGYFYKVILEEGQVMK